MRMLLALAFLTAAAQAKPLCPNCSFEITFHDPSAKESADGHLNAVGHQALAEAVSASLRASPAL